ncbi:DUF1622 domain-containing protein [Altererythrobacter sp. H2]|uniref:DUF1622 domain-containing protein n=1 Tax=Altererythrobacter sp. H2 TaxID=3108391 RepID=UPI002B4BC80D|nr:DUF1622 domain-containing protein [Altererythrobacter sp. H2]WRK96737.1 DUF1622 domain-containing protein [Altererythrobacter sp. H2]
MIGDDTIGLLARSAAQVFEVAGIGVIVAGSLVAVVLFAMGMVRLQTYGQREKADDPVAIFRRALGRSILVGLELLVAADIIRTLAVDPTIDSVLVLAVIVLIRTFLSFSLEVEIDGRWPWQKQTPSTKEGGP